MQMLLSISNDYQKYWKRINCCSKVLLKTTKRSPENKYSAHHFSSWICWKLAPRFRTHIKGRGRPGTLIYLRIALQWVNKDGKGISLVVTLLVYESGKYGSCVDGQWVNKVDVKVAGPHQPPGWTIWRIVDFKLLSQNGWCKGCWRGKAQDPDQGEPFGVSQFSLPDQSR